MWFGKAIVCWVCIMPLAILNGGLRDHVWARWLPPRAALALSGLLLSGCIVAVAAVGAPWMGLRTPAQGWATGALWVLLTHAFDAAMLWREGKPLRALWQAYDVRTGNLWALVTAACLLAPVWAASA